MNPEMPIPQWKDVEAKLPSNLPDKERDAIRLGWFTNQLWPALLSQGRVKPVQYGAAQTEFMKMTERADKSKSPRLAVVAKSAAAAAARPVLSIDKQMAGPLPNGEQHPFDAMNEWEAAAADEARKQGINPGVYQTAGGLLGALPYFVPAAGALRGAGLTAEAAMGGGLGARMAARGATDAVAMGAYGAASAAPGERTAGALHGAGMGAVLGAGAALGPVPSAALNAAAMGGGAALAGEDWDEVKKQALLGGIMGGLSGLRHDGAPAKEPPPVQETGRDPLLLGPGQVPRSRWLPPGAEPGGPYPMPGIFAGELPPAPLPRSRWLGPGSEPGGPYPMPGDLQGQLPPGRTPLQIRGASPGLPSELRQFNMGDGGAGEASMGGSPKKQPPVTFSGEQYRKATSWLAANPGATDAQLARAVKVKPEAIALMKQQMVADGILPKVAAPEAAPTAAAPAAEPAGPSLLERAKAFAIEQGKVSASSLQKQFKMRWDAANELLGQLEAAKIIGPAEGKKPRLVTSVAMEEAAAAKRDSLPVEASRGTIYSDGTNAAETGGTGIGDPLPEVRPASFPVALGAETEVVVPGVGVKYRARYVVRELEDVAGSHNGLTFQKNPRYTLENDRRYDTDKAAQNKVLTHVENFDPEIIISDNKTHSAGPSMIDADGNVLGGNGRVMTLERVYAESSGARRDAYKRTLMSRASRFGLDPKEIERMRKPVLVREIADTEWDRLGAVVPARDGMTPRDAAKQAAITHTNAPEGATYSTNEQGIADARLLQPRTVQFLEGVLHDAGEEATLRQVLDGPAGRELGKRLRDDGVVTHLEQGQFFDKDGELTNQGKDRIVRAFTGRVFVDTAQLDRTPEPIIAKMERVAGSLAQVSGRGDFDLLPDVRQALTALEEARARGVRNLDLIFDQARLDREPYSGRARVLAKVISEDGVNNIGKRFRAYASDVAAAEQAAGGLGLTTPPSPNEIFARAFAGKVPMSEAEGTLEAARAAMERGEKLRFNTARRGMSEEGWIIMPDGRMVDLAGGQLHHRMQDVQGAGGLRAAIQSGAIRGRGNGIEVQSLNSAPLGRLRVALERAAKNSEHVFIDTEMGSYIYRSEELAANGWDPKGVRPDKFYAKSYNTRMQNPLPQPEIPLRDRPTGEMGTTGGKPIPGAPSEVSAATWLKEPGKAASIFRNVNREDVFHEGLHRTILEQGIDSAEAVLSEVNGAMAGKLKNAIPAELYKQNPHEEVFVRLATAVRQDQQPVLDRFVKADGSMEEVLDFAAQQARAVQGELAKRADSPQRRMAERKLQEVIRRAERGIEIAKREAELAGHEVKFENGRFRVKEAGSTQERVFSSREAFDKWMDERATPKEAPEFISAEGALPGTPNAPNFAGPQEKVRFNTNPPIPPEPTPGKPQPGKPGTRPIRGGWNLANFWWTPKLAWVQQVAQKHQWPELYDSMLKMDTAAHEMNQYLSGVYKDLNGILGKYKAARYNDLWEYLTIKEQVAAGKLSDSALAAAERNLKITPKEIEAMGKVREWLNNLGKEFGIDAQMWISEYLPRLRKSNFDPDILKNYSKLPDGLKFFAEMERIGELDNRDTNLLRILYNYARLGARKKFLNEPYKAAKELVNQTIEQEDKLGEFLTAKYKVPVAGNLRGLLNRHLEFMIGRPDSTQRGLESVMRSGIDTINSGIEAMNKRLPGYLRMEKLDETGADALNKFMLMQTAGGLGFRPLVPIRDSLQVFLAYPMLGEKYFVRGLTGAVSKQTRQLAEKFGVLAHENDVLNHLAGSGGDITKLGPVAKLAQKSIEPQRWSSNLTRLATFRGFYDKISDAAPEFRATGDGAKFLRQSGVQFLDQQMAANFLRDLAAASDRDVQNVVGQMAARLTETSQWSFTKGAQAGIYQYGLGRVFGQYGTWPTNYLTYLKRVLFNPGLDKTERAKTISRFMLSHAAIAAAGDMIGVDTSSLVFTQPLTYAGGPLLQATLNAPLALDIESRRGEQARDNIGRAVGLTIPGYVEWAGIYDAIATDDPDWFIKLLGVTKITPEKERRPLHQIDNAILGELE